jgi:hypothetical protein
MNGRRIGVTVLFFKLEHRARHEQRHVVERGHGHAQQADLGRLEMAGTFMDRDMGASGQIGSIHKGVGALRTQRGHCP